MHTTIVCGLLGSGKTTFIKNYVSGLSGRVVVLVNDFGAADIDGEILSAEDIRSLELPSGCVCCTLRFDLITTIQRIVSEFAPDHLVIEPSGVASPSAVIEALEDAGQGPAAVVGIVDVSEFLDLFDSGMYGGFFENQIACSDVILVNKTDRAEEKKIVETLERIESINPRAILYRTVNARFPDGEAARHIGVKRRTKAAGTIGIEAPHLHLETLSFKLAQVTRLSRFSELFDRLAEGQFGNVARAKALLTTDEGPYRFDSVFGKVDKIPFRRNIENSRLVVIGMRLDRERVERALSENGSC